MSKITQLIDKHIEEQRRMVEQVTPPRPRFHPVREWVSILIVVLGVGLTLWLWWELIKYIGSDF